MQRSEHVANDLRRVKQKRDEVLAAPSAEKASDAWRDFLACLDALWNRANAHFGKSAAYNGWKGPWLRLVRDDPLINYLSKARDADHHTVELKTIAPTSIAVPSGGHLLLRHTAQPDTWEIEMSHMAKFVLAHLKLHPATSRQRTWELPTAHLGHPIDPDNIREVMDFAVAFYENFLAEAESRFCRDQ